METDLNKADINDLPDLSGEVNRGADVDPTTTDANPDVPPTSNEGDPPVAEGGDPPKEPEGNEPPSDTDPPKEGDEPTEGEPATEPPVQQNNDDVLSEMSEGRVASADDLQGLLSHYDEMAEAMKNPEMLVPEGKARDAFKYAMQFPGDNAALANQSFHHLMSINTETLTPKELQFEAYMLKEENADLIETPAKAKEYFEAEYERTFGELEDSDDPILQRQHQLATNQAKGIINDKKAQFQSETPANNDEPILTPEEIKAYNDTLDNTLNDYDGVAFEFSEDGKEGMNFILDDPKQKAEFQNYVRNPDQWFNNFVTGFLDEKGNLNSDGLADAMMLAIHGPELLQLSYDRGKENAKQAYEDELRNSSSGTEPGGTPAPEKKGFLDTFAEAMG
jgi:hypothetical protein